MQLFLLKVIYMPDKNNTACFPFELKLQHILFVSYSGANSLGSQYT